MSAWQPGAPADRGADSTRARIYHALVDLTVQAGRPPTLREIARQVGLSSTGNMTYHLALLVHLGLLRNLGGARGYIAVRRWGVAAAAETPQRLAAASPPSRPWEVAAAAETPQRLAAAYPPRGPAGVAS